MLFDSIYFYLAVIPLVIFGLGYWKQNMVVYCNHTPPGSIGSYVYLPSRYNLLFEDVWMRTRDGVRIHAWLIRGLKKQNGGQSSPSTQEKDTPSSIPVSLSSAAVSADAVSAIGGIPKNLSSSSNASSGSCISTTTSASSTSSSESALMESFNTPTLLYFHGNAGNISHRLLNVREMYRAGLQCNILMVEYRGYGRSEGEPNEQGLMYDAECALEYIQSRNDINGQKVFLFGRSLGGAVCVHLFEKYGHLLRGMILENTFLSIPKMVDVLFPSALRFLKLLSRNRWNSEECIQRVDKDAPILFLAGKIDELVPHEHMLHLYRLCTSKLKELVVFSYGKHNETWLQPEYNETIINFINRHQ